MEGKGESVGKKTWLILICCCVLSSMYYCMLLYYTTLILLLDFSLFGRLCFFISVCLSVCFSVYR